MKRFLLLILTLAVASGMYAYLPQNSLSKTSSPVLVEAASQPAAVNLTPMSSGMLQQVNAERSKLGVQSLEVDQRLMDSAQTKADDEQVNGYYGHANPATGKRGYEYAHEQMPQCTRVGENLLVNSQENTSASAIQIWMGSKLHREAILDPRHDYVGFGVNGKLVVMHFCDLD